jgi:hypothetical protein
MALKRKSATQHIRDILAVKPHASTGYIQDRLVAKGVAVSKQQIYGARNAIRKQAAQVLPPQAEEDNRPATRPETVAAGPNARSLAGELWREYQYGNTTVHIDNPQQLVVGNTTHRVLCEDGTVLIVPAVGQLGCTVRIMPRDPNNWCQF